MAGWRLAKSLETFRAQVNARFPGRSKASDGTIGDTAHSARTSDHNPGPDSIVEAIDITHDPKSGCDAAALAEALRNSRDVRIKYIISNARICAGVEGPRPWQWRQYNGTNPHNHHMHLSVRHTMLDDARPWAAVSAMGREPVGLLDVSAKSHKQTFARRVRNWVVGATSGIGGFSGLAYWTDWQVAAVFFVFLGVLIVLVVGGVFWLFGADTVRAWIRRKVQ